MWILMLNDMRSAHFEDTQPVAKSEVLEDLKELVQKYKVEPYQEPKFNIFGEEVGEWSKSFAKGSPLEWFNPPMDCCENYVLYQDPLKLIPNADLL
jgi:hypothetical protein